MQTNNSKPFHNSPIRRFFNGIKGHELILNVITTFMLGAGSIFIITPFLYMLSTSLKDINQLRSNPLAFIPTESKMANIAGKDEPLYTVIIDGVKNELALVKNLTEGKGIFVDPADPSVQQTLVIKEQKELRVTEIHWENYPEALTSVPFDRYIMNTLLVTFVTMIGMLFSCSLVAYGFSRFRAPWLNVLFLVLLSTIMLPGQVRMIPMYVFFQKIGWVDTFLPLLVPAFFANAYDAAPVYHDHPARDGRRRPD
jgi:multiple sugar transport system permease protein